jgi:gamma-glutamyltranspeptidase / glutathione hydrolase
VHINEDLESGRTLTEAGPVRNNAVIASSHPLATNSGLRILKHGGNAVDAAVATALTLGVVAPAFSGIGGGGFMLIYESRSGNISAIDYRETAPILSSAVMFESTTSDENRIGSKAIATPSTLLGLSLALEKFGTKSFAQVSEDAANFATEGFAVNKFLSRAMHEDSSLEKFRRFSESSKFVLRNNREPKSEGDNISFPALGNLLKSAAASGNIRNFYTSDFARTVAEFVSSKGGVLSKEDFAKYQPKVREPVTAQIEDYSVASLPPPSSGGICLVQLLKMAQDLGEGLGHNSAKAIDLMAHYLEKIYQDRQRTIADPEFVSIDSKKLVSDNYVENLKKSPDGMSRKASSANSQTTHLSVIDSQGNIVSLTESLECYFGSGVFVPGMDLFLNDTMHDFDQDSKSINSVAPMKRPRSSMTPTILFKDERPFLVLGSAGGPRIISSTFQVILNVIHFGMDIERAVSSPRIHYEGNKTLYLEDGAASDSSRADLSSFGYNLQSKHDYFFGGVNAIEISGNKAYGATDPRRD